MSARRIRSALIAGLVAAAAFAAAIARADVAVEARLDRSRVEAGGSVVLELEVRGGSGTIGDPELVLPQGASVLASSRAQNFSWINGRSSSTLVFRYELGVDSPGRYTLGPFRVVVGGQTYQSGTLELVATAARGAGGGAAASLVVGVEPRTPYVGEPVLLRARLLQRQDFAETPGFTAPATPGFWSERYSQSESYFEPGSGNRVLVTETRARLYPLAAGRATIGSAFANVVLAGGGGDPLGLFGGTRREVQLQSAPVAVDVRPLPGGAPAGFDGAVGRFTVAWSPDRAHTPVDVPLTLRLDVRGEGNLPLLHTPELVLRDFEVFAGTVEDSLGPPGQLGAGRRRFQWTLLPRHQGALEVPPPAFAWFDPAASAYRSFESAPIAITGEGPVYGDRRDREGFPDAFRSRRADPGRRPALPWAWAIAGAAAGFAVRFFRRGPTPDDRAALAKRREWLQTIGLARGPDFWRSADQAATFLESGGFPVGGLRQEIDAARYGGASAGEERVRRQLVERLGADMDRARSRVPWKALGAALAAGAIVLAWLTAPGAGDARGRAEALRADALAEKGDVAAASHAWRAQWKGTSPDAALAARLAWSEIEAGHVGGAAAWVLRGWRGESRDPALGWVSERVREAGGLGGAERGRLPLRSLEWAALAALFAGAGVVAWPRRALAAAALALAVALAGLTPLSARWRAERDQAVVLENVKLAGPELDLQAGQVVRVLGTSGDAAEVRVGREVRGRLPLSALERVSVAP